MSDMTEAPRLDADTRADGGFGGNMRLLADIPVRMSVEVGSTQLRLAEIMQLGEGSVVQLDRQADELLDIMVNGTLVARGEVVTVNGRYGVRIVEIASAEARLAGIERRA
ncbi:MULTISPECIES: flagellar motor switch protein FliN [Sphingobium]|uniref:Flagellar motor switch protein FliN n=1 Tax=Sphingobium lignivorans TaxID=2735886 RepID=A0ABR6NAK1_9SPHN|nr:MULTISPECIES: flagellar motor switch protein FliN [Sphingobium]MBB5984284.1 flagellar motor switch protein FliN/FliY [Sphingobium lignivorans]BAK64960.1 flagellar motor switch protein FliN [Sphingobium sp. SYK-6]